MEQKIVVVGFKLQIGTQEAFGTHNKALNVEVQNDIVPAGRNPLDYLRERVREELNRASGKIVAETPEAL